MDVINHIIDPPDEFNYEPHSHIKTEAIFTEGLHPQSLAIDLQTFDEEFFKQANSVTDIEPIKDSATTIKTTPEASRPSSPKRKSSAESVKSILKSSPTSPTPPNRQSAKSNSTQRQSSAGSEKRTASPRGTSAGSSRLGSSGSVRSASSGRRSASVKSATSRKTVKSAEKVDESVKEPEEPPEIDDRIVAWNSTPANVAMQQHILRHKHAQKGASFDVDAILAGRREEEHGKVRKRFYWSFLSGLYGDLTPVKSSRNLLL